ncbi:MAG: hypothetical protein ACKVOX_04010 [Rhizobacter sp.]
MIANVGPARTITVTFLILAVTLLFGCVFLGESLTPPMIGGFALIPIGAGFETGLLTLPSRA